MAAQRFEVLLETAALGLSTTNTTASAPCSTYLRMLLVLRLPGHGEALDAHLEATDRTEVDRQEVEQQRRILFGVDRHQLHFVARAEDAVHLLQAGCLATNPDPVVDEFGVDRSLGDVDETHLFSCWFCLGQQMATATYSSATTATSSFTVGGYPYRGSLACGSSACQLPRPFCIDVAPHRTHGT